MKHTKEELKTLQSRSLQGKIQLTQTRIIEFYEYYGGKVYISFSGGKDSTVLLDLARRIYPDIPAVFADTGLEYPEIKEFAKFEAVEIVDGKRVGTPRHNLVVVRPKMTFKEVIEKYGYPVISKEVAKSAYYAQHGSDWAIKRFDGQDKSGKETKFKKRFKKYKYLINAPFNVSALCCEHIKKQPLKEYEKSTGRKPIIATMAHESQQREAGWLKVGCNAFNNGRSQPMSFWFEQDILSYLEITKIPYCSVYGQIEDDTCGQLELIETEHKLHTTGVSRTGCMFCMFGVQRDKEPNRFQRMKETHPKLYSYCINDLGCGSVLDYIGVKY